MGTLRKLWREHLGLCDDQELLAFIDRMRFHIGPLIDELGHRLSDRFHRVGLKPDQKHLLSNPYDDLVKKLLVNGATTMTTTERPDMRLFENG